MQISHTDRCLDHLNGVVTVAEAAHMYGVTPRWITAWCELGIVCARKTLGGSYMISVDDLIKIKGEPKRWPDTLNLPERGEI